MKTENREKLQELIEKVETFRDEIYDYDYDGHTLWLLDQAIFRMKQI